MNLLFILFTLVFSFDSVNNNIGLVQRVSEERAPECYTNLSNSFEQNELMAQIAKDTMGIGAIRSYKDQKDKSSQGVQE